MARLMFVRAGLHGRMGWFVRSELERAGWRRAAIESAISDGRLIRARRGHYCTPDVDSATIEAVRVGGQLACVSELRRLGAWVLADDRIHVQLPPHASRLRHHENCVLHWVDARTAPGTRHVPVEHALESAIGCLERRSAVAVVDSAMHLGLISVGEVRALGERSSSDRRAILRLADPLAESGLESIVRVLMHDLRLRVRGQVPVAGIGRVDLLVEDWIVVEVDGDAFHDEKVTTRDRRRDARLTTRGLCVVHFRYAQVVFELPTVAEAVIAAVANHRRIHNSGRIAARARARLRRLDFS